MHSHHVRTKKCSCWKQELTSLSPALLSIAAEMDRHQLILGCSDVMVSARALVDIICLVYSKVLCAMPISHAYSWPST